MSTEQRVFSVPHQIVDSVRRHVRIANCWVVECKTRVTLTIALFLTNMVLLYHVTGALRPVISHIFVCLNCLVSCHCSPSAYTRVDVGFPVELNAEHFARVTRSSVDIQLNAWALNVPLMPDP